MSGEQHHRASASNIGCADRFAQDTLFATLFLTSVVAYLAGNLLLLSREVFVASSYIMVPVGVFWLIFYALSVTTRNVLWGASLSLCIVFICCRALPNGGVVLFAAAGVAALIYTLRRCRPPKGVAVSLLAMASLAAATIFSSFGVFTYFDNLQMAVGRGMHPDVAFHATISAMIKNYGVVSTGLNGPVGTPYYALLHHFAALASALSGQGTLEVWGMLLYVLCLPLLIFASVHAFVCFGGEPARIPTAWAVVCLMLVIPQFVIGQWMALHFTYFSETYVLSIALLLLCLPLLAKRDFKWQDVALAVVATCVVAYAKGTTAVILAGLFGARWLFVDKARLGTGFAATLASLAVIAVFVLFVSKSTQTSQGGLTTDVLQIVRMGPGGDALDQAIESFSKGEFVDPGLLFRAAGSLASFVCFHFLVSWIVLASVVHRVGLGGLFASPVAVAILGSVLGGFFFMVFFTSPGGVNIWYFTSPAYFVALPAFVGLLVAALGRFALPPWQWLGIAAAFCLVTGTSYKSYYRQSFLAPLRRQAVDKDLFVDAMLDLRRKVPRNVVMRAEPSAWLIEPTYHQDAPDRWPAPLVFTALSERAWIGIIRPLDHGHAYPTKDYGFSFYGIDSSGLHVPASSALTSETEVREWAPSKELLDAETSVARRIASTWSEIFGTTKTHGSGR